MGDRVVEKLSNIKIRESHLQADTRTETRRREEMTKKIDAFLDLFVVICGNKNDYFYLAIEINVLLGNAHYPENVEDASDVNRLALCGPSIWREHVSARGNSHNPSAFQHPLSHNNCFVTTIIIIIIKLERLEPFQNHSENT
jgi:hypothetical protein